MTSLLADILFNTNRKGMSHCAVSVPFRLPMVMQVLHLSASDSSLVRDVLVQHAGVFARPEVLKEGFQAAVSKPSKDPAHAITSQELALLQVIHPLQSNYGVYHVATM